MAARDNYLGQDRMDMQFVAKEISKFTSKPEDQDRRTAKCLARYLDDNQRISSEYAYHELPKKVVIWSDTDSAG